uniref:Uncharacterized protein n=1 Tax=Arion vulgaris TaxID=1028688 RepID=A0A0B7AG64_9EUPU
MCLCSNRQHHCRDCLEIRRIDPCSQAGIDKMQSLLSLDTVHHSDKHDLMSDKLR